MPRRHRRLGRAAGVALVALLALAPTLGAQPLRALDGRILAPQEPGPEFRQRQEALLAEAIERRASDVDDADSWIWVGRRQAYLGRYEEALATFGEAIERFPEDARFLRHRGHRLITLRRLDEAIADLSRAAATVTGQPDQVEPDGLPNALGVPTSTLQTNIFYHLGLAHYLRGDFAAAVEAYERCRDMSRNPDMLVAATYWLYLGLRRAGREADAEAALATIGPDLELIENDGYYDLLRAFGGSESAEDLLATAGADATAVAFPTTAYGVGAWHLIAGREERAREIFEAVVSSPAVAAFGYIAAEAELARDTRAGRAPEER